MPSFLLNIFSIVTLYAKIRVIQITLKIGLFMLLFTFVKDSLNYALNILTTRLSTFQLPCNLAFIINSLDVLPMFSFAISFLAMTYLTRYFVNFASKIL